MIGMPAKHHSAYSGFWILPSLIKLKEKHTKNIKFGPLGQNFLDSCLHAISLVLFFFKYLKKIYRYVL